jgi:two-component system response regulator NreC
VELSQGEKKERGLMRIVQVAAEPAFRLGFRVVMEAQHGWTVVGDASDARAGLRAVDLEKPDLVVAEIALPGLSGIELIRELRHRVPTPHSMLLATRLCERDVIDGFAAGARGFALKSDSAECLRQAAALVGTGGSYVPDQCRGANAEDLVRRLRSPAGAAPDVLSPLSTRERTVLRLVLQGWRNRDISKELCISVKTVDTHRTHINRKLNCSGTGDLMRFAADNRLLLTDAPTHDLVPAAVALSA